MCVAAVESLVVRVNKTNERLEPNMDPDMRSGSLENCTELRDHPRSADPSSPQTLSFPSPRALTLPIWDVIGSHGCTSKGYRTCRTESIY